MCVCTGPHVAGAAGVCLQSCWERPGGGPARPNKPGAPSSRPPSDCRLFLSLPSGPLSRLPLPGSGAGRGPGPPSPLPASFPSRLHPSVCRTPAWTPRGPFPSPSLVPVPSFLSKPPSGRKPSHPREQWSWGALSCLGTRTRTGWGQGRAGAEHPSRRCVRLCLRPDPKAAPSSHQRESCPEMEEPLALQTRPDWRRVGLFEASTLRAPELSPGPGLGPPGCPSARVVFPEHLLSAGSSRLALSTPTAAQQGPWWCPGPAAEEADRGEGTCLKGQNQGPRPERCRAPPSPQGPELLVSSPVRVAARRLPGLLSHLLPTHPSDRSGKSRWERGRELRSQTSRARAWALCLFSFPNPRASLSSPLPVPGAAGALGAALRERPCGQSALSRQQPRPKASRRHLRKQSPSLPGAEKLR